MAWHFFSEGPKKKRKLDLGGSAGKTLPKVTRSSNRHSVGSLLRRSGVQNSARVLSLRKVRYVSSEVSYLFTLDRMVSEYIISIIKLIVNFFKL